jgi:hypothetical protein
MTSQMLPQGTGLDPGQHHAGQIPYVDSDYPD